MRPDRHPPATCSGTWGISVLALIATTLLHAVLILPAFLTFSLTKSKVPSRLGAAASASTAHEEPVMTVILINDPAVGQLHPVEVKPLPSRGVAPLDLPVVVLSPKPTVAGRASVNDDSPPSEAASDEAAGDQVQHALLFGRYLTQIQARIERAWLRPRSAIGASSFSCSLRILQDHTGNVLEIAFQQCNGTRRWRDSLASAIHTASPLPVPPDTGLSTDVLSLVFASDGFRPRESTEGFEPDDRMSLALIREAAARDSFTRFAHSNTQDGASDAEDAGVEKHVDQSGVLHLTIVGSPPGAAALPPADPTAPSSTSDDATAAPAPE